MAERTDQPHERIMALAAYARARRDVGFDLGDVARDVPGYSDLTDANLRKKVQRDRRELTEAFGIDIEWSDENQNYTVAPPVFTEEEWRALLAAAGAVAVPGVDHAVVSDRAEVSVAGDPRLCTIRDAIAERRVIGFRYRGHSRRVRPYAIGMWRHHWYVHGLDDDIHEVRNFRLDRIAANEPSIVPIGDPDAFAIPDAIDPAVVFRMDPDAWGDDPPLFAFVRVTSDAVPSFREEFAESEEWQRTLGDTTFRIEVRHYDAFMIRLLGFGTTVRLTQPPELVDRLHDWLRGQAEDY